MEILPNIDELEVKVIASFSPSIIDHDLGTVSLFVLNLYCESLTVPSPTSIPTKSVVGTLSVVVALTPNRATTTSLSENSRLRAQPVVPYVDLVTKFPTADTYTSDSDPATENLPPTNEFVPVKALFPDLVAGSGKFLMSHIL